jgi:transcriptional regulator with XRE-family HTH domain
MSDTFGQRLRAARLAAGIRQRDLAQALGRSQSAVSLWEAGRHTPDTAARATLAAVLRAQGVDATDLLDA